MVRGTKVGKQISRATDGEGQSWEQLSERFFTLRQHFPAGQPFGGYKQSRIGREQVADTLEHYSQTKTINMNL